MDEVFGIAAFRSRQQVMNFEGALRRAGLRVKVISTPRDVAVGCGLSVRFEIADAGSVMQVLQKTRARQPDRPVPGGQAGRGPAQLNRAGADVAGRRRKITRRPLAPAARGV